MLNLAWNAVLFQVANAAPGLGKPAAPEDLRIFLRNGCISSFHSG